MEFQSGVQISVRFVSDDDVTNVFVPLSSEGPSASQNSLKWDNELLDLDLPDLPGSSVQNKQSCLFESGDIAGKNIFGFQTPNRRNAMVNKVCESTCKTPRLPLQEEMLGKATSVQHSPSSFKAWDKSKFPSEHKSFALSTPKVSSQRKNDSIPKKLDNSICPQTPYNLRKRFKRKLLAVASEENNCLDESEEDFSASESDWDNNNISDASSSDESLDEESKKEIQKPALPKNGSEFGPSRSKNLTLNFVPAAEEYFQSHASRKIHTSNRTLGKLRHCLPQEKLQELLSETAYSHEKLLTKMQDQTCSFFTKWNFILREGFNILLYGVGSKHSLLSSFHQQLPEPSIVVNGFFPSLTIQEIVSSVVEDVLDLHGLAADIQEMVDCIRNAFSQQQNSRLFLVIHNIDGIMLRNDKSQEVLALLSSTPNIHLIASIDHISAPLMWDQHMLGMFNFSWWDITTFQPYVNETAFESSLLVQQSGNLALSSLQNVFRSLTNTAKSIFMLMIEYQKEHKDTSNYSGMSFKKLYTACRESLLVSSDLALRSQLTEFLDHNLVKSCRGQDGLELLVIPIDSSVLDHFIAHQTML